MHTVFKIVGSTQYIECSMKKAHTSIPFPTLYQGLSSLQALGILTPLFLSLKKNIASFIHYSLAPSVPNETIMCLCPFHALSLALSCLLAAPKDGLSVDT